MSWIVDFPSKAFEKSIKIMIVVVCSAEGSDTARFQPIENRHNSSQTTLALTEKVLRVPHWIITKVTQRRQ